MARVLFPRIDPSAPRAWVKFRGRNLLHARPLRAAKHCIISTTTTSIASVLNALIETCKDGEEGFRDAAENSKNLDYQSLYSELSMQRQQFATELQTLVRGLNETPEKDGSVAGAMHRGWIDLKSAITSGDDHSILAECERGEDSAVAEYKEALEHTDLPVHIRTVIHRQYLTVQAAHDRVRDLRDNQS